MNAPWNDASLDNPHVLAIKSESTKVNSNCGCHDFESVACSQYVRCAIAVGYPHINAVKAKCNRTRVRSASDGCHHVATITGADDIHSMAKNVHHPDICAVEGDGSGTTADRCRHHLHAITGAKSADSIAVGVRDPHI